MKGRILITGGAGYIGSHANLQLVSRGYETIILDNLVYGHRELVKDGEFLLGDTGDRELLELLFRNYRIDAVMHFAAFAYVGESVTSPALYYHNNVVNTLTLLEAMRTANVDKIVFSSTCATYGNPLATPITEEHPQQPINPYGRSKLMIEQILEDYSRAYGLRYVSLRYFNAAGADPQTRVGELHEPETHLIPLALEAAIDPSRSLSIFGTNYDTPDGTCIRDYIHVSDLASAHDLALQYLMDGGASDVFNLGNGQGFSVKDVIDCAQKITGKGLQVIQADRRPGDPPKLVGSAEKARATLGWNPQYEDLDVMVETAWKWLSKRRR
jgi:UDP-glucose 4-epimerase